MTTTIDRRRDLMEATGRYALYNLLASGLAFPTADRLEMLHRRMLPALGALALNGPLGDALEAVVTNAPSDLDRWREHHMALFPPIASQDAPGYETAYRGDGIFQQTALMADIAGFYRAHGLRAGGTHRERLDHITVELEFMSFLAKKETVAIRSGSADQVELCRETSALFLRDHLGCWARAFGTRASAVGQSLWLRSLGGLLATWVSADMAAFGLEPLDLVEEPMPQEPLDDGSCGPCPTGAMGL